MPDDFGRFRGIAISGKAAETYDRIFPKQCVRDGACAHEPHNITAGYRPGDRVIDAAGYEGTVIRDERYQIDTALPHDRIWVRLDDGDNPVAYRTGELARTD